MNGYKGEISIELYGINYQMKVDIGAIAEFQSETGKDFMAVSAKALNAFYRSREMDTFIDRAEAMTAAVSMIDAATMFWICSKRSNKNVEFEEFQEACLLEGITEENGAVRSYPIKFIQLCEFATLGIIDNVKKKKSIK